MAKTRRSNRNNFLTWQRVVGDLTLAQLQASGVPSAPTLDDALVLTVKSDNSGTSANDEFLIPTTGTGYNYDVWTDEGHEWHNQAGDALITFDTAGTHEIRIYGDFPRIYFNNGGDKLKLLKVSQWGTIAWGSMNAAFYGCSNLNVVALDVPNLTSVAEMTAMFRDCTLFNTDLSQWVFSALADATNMLTNTAFSTVNYDLLLAAWAAQTKEDNVTLSTGPAYSQGVITTGTATQSISNKLVSAGQNFTAIVSEGDIVHNTTDDTFAQVTAVDSDTALSLDSDIFIFSETYTIQGSAAAKGRYSLIVDNSWTITDGGPA